MNVVWAQLAHAMAELPSWSRGMKEPTAEARAPSALPEFLRGGIRLSSTKKPRLATGIKNNTTSHSGRPADLSLRIVIARPTQMNGSAVASIVAKNVASADGKEIVRMAWTGGTQ